MADQESEQRLHVAFSRVKSDVNHLSDRIELQNRMIKDFMDGVHTKLNIERELDKDLEELKKAVVSAKDVVELKKEVDFIRENLASIEKSAAAQKELDNKLNSVSKEIESIKKASWKKEDVKVEIKKLLGMYHKIEQIEAALEKKGTKVEENIIKLTMNAKVNSIKNKLDKFIESTVDLNHVQNDFVNKVSFNDLSKKVDSKIENLSSSFSKLKSETNLNLVLKRLEALEKSNLEANKALIAVNKQLHSMNERMHSYKIANTVIQTFKEDLKRLKLEIDLVKGESVKSLMFNEEIAEVANNFQVLYKKLGVLEGKFLTKQEAQKRREELQTEIKKAFVQLESLKKSDKDKRRIEELKKETKQEFGKAFAAIESIKIDTKHKEKIEELSKAHEETKKEMQKTAVHVENLKKDTKHKERIEELAKDHKDVVKELEKAVVQIEELKKDDEHKEKIAKLEKETKQLKVDSQNRLAKATKNIMGFFVERDKSDKKVKRNLKAQQKAIAKAKAKVKPIIIKTSKVEIKPKAKAKPKARSKPRSIVIKTSKVEIKSNAKSKKKRAKPLKFENARYSPNRGI